MNPFLIYLIGVPCWFVVTAICDNTADATPTIVNLIAYIIAALLWPAFLVLTAMATVAVVCNAIGGRLRR